VLVLVEEEVAAEVGAVQQALVAVEEEQLLQGQTALTRAF
jgi:hypothetical protein